MFENIFNIFFIKKKKIIKRVNKRMMRIQNLIKRKEKKNNPKDIKTSQHGYFNLFDLYIKNQQEGLECRPLMHIMDSLEGKEQNCIPWQDVFNPKAKTSFCFISLVRD